MLRWILTRLVDPTLPLFEDDLRRLEALAWRRA